MDKRGRVKIADFGLAKLLGTDTRDYTITQPGHVMGTPHYMAPEQVEKPLEVDHRADIFSLGVVFYEMLTGELPLGRFASPSQKVQIDVRLDDVVLRALEKEPDRRYQHASQIKTAVDTIAATTGAPPPVIPPTPPPSAATPPPPRRRRPVQTPQSGRRRCSPAITF
jgi:serine/threonine protein kinase